MVYVIQVCWQLAALISQIYFCNKTLHVSNISSVHHQEFFTVHTAMVYVIQFCWQLAASKLSANLYDIYHCCVYSEKLLMMDRRTGRNMRSFIPKNIFEKLVHLVGFVVRIREKELSALLKGQIANPTPANTLLPSVVIMCHENFKLPYTQSILRCSLISTKAIHFCVMTRIRV